MIAFKCRYCGKSYSFEILPIPDEGAEFKCAKCGKNSRLLKRGKVVFCIGSENSDELEQSATMELADSYQSAVEDAVAPEELESRLRGMYPELPYDTEFRLGIVKGPDQGTTFTLTKPSVSIGKSGCDINLADGRVSNKHCQIEIYGNQMIVLRDLQSDGGTYRNNYPTTLTCLRPGDSLQIGNSELILIQAQKKLAK
ncbi:FHA domain-containing protein [bacterium]|nr:FHA domain-containing protein [candidate division CSSED10-310 bacterium]